MSNNPDDANIGNIPSNGEDLRKLKAQFQEYVRCCQRIADEKEALKDLRDTLAKDYQIPKKMVTKVGNTMYKHNFSDVQAEHEHFETLYETLLTADSRRPASQNDDEDDDDEENEEENEEDNT